MIGTGVLVLLLAPASAGVAPRRIEYAQLTIEQRVIIRVPTRPASGQVRWKEKRGPRCMPMRGIAGAAVVKPDSVDIIFRGGRRFRAELASRCPALDYYRGFYIAPTADRMICSDRDAIHSRSGGECQIKRFRSLVPVEDK